MNRRDLIKQAALAAGKYIKSANPEEGIIQKEGRGNFATAADLASEKMIIDLIKKHFPDDQILSEETNAQLPNFMSADHLWVIDPIDGTNNYAHHRNYSCVSIGYAEQGIVKLGAVYNPFVDELFFAEKGRGAFVNNQRIVIGTQTSLSQGVICTDNSYDHTIGKRHLSLMLSIDPTPFMLIKGSAALIMCDIAAGRADLYFHTDICPWDNAAGFLMIEEAGGVTKNFRGKKITFDSAEIVVGNEALVDTFIKIVSLHPGGV